jgi:hypothetical protein
VDVEFPLYSPAELQSATAITEQMLTILTRKETLRQIATLAPTDILIQPQLGTFSSSDFSASADAIAKGIAAAMQAEDRLRELAVDAEAFAAYTERRQPIKRKAERLAFVRIEHDDRIATTLLGLKSDVSDEIFNVASGVETSLIELAEALMRVMGKEMAPEFGPPRGVNAVPRRLACTKKAEEMLGFKSSVDLDEGLRRLVTWWRANREHVA